MLAFNHKMETHAQNGQLSSPEATSVAEIEGVEGALEQRAAAEVAKGQIGHGSVSDVKEVLIYKKSPKSLCVGIICSDKLSYKAALAGVWRRKIIEANSYEVLIV